MGSFVTFSFFYYFYCRYNLAYNKFYYKKYERHVREYNEGLTGYDHPYLKEDFTKDE